MSLYIRVLNNFYTHRKTLRLRALIGDDAFWIPPRLWAYAAENQPNGCFSDYSAKEIAMLIGYSKDATSMLEALIQASFLDENPLRIHDWEDHNGYHKIFSERAKKGASARWGKNPPPVPPIKTVQDKTRQETSIASSMKPAEKAIDKSSEVSNHAAFIDSWMKAFKSHFGLEYVFDGGRDGKAVRELLRMNRKDLIEVALKAWNRAAAMKSFNCEHASTIHGFKNYFNQIQVELKNGNSHQPHNKRNEGVAGAGRTDWGAAAQRKLERQMAQTSNPPPSAQGNGT